MARPPKVRESYRRDASALLTLASAVKEDKKRPADWRNGIIAKLESLAGELLAAPPPKTDSG